jgi:hypothetical protein
MQKSILVPLIAACAVFSCDVSLAQQHDPWPAAPVVPDNAPLSASLTFDGRSAAAGMGYLWGHGILSYGDKQLHFKLSGISIADVGGAKINGEGDVYNLVDLKDFAGKYSMVTAGVTLGAGGSVAYL